ncbi:TetR/AcrR family transcriptional regulator [Paraburkholderia sp. RP-4-7]|uniref:TetR/AcrR family transcriptional regulator n=2 Tax=Paraburkholderia polaris TaxID=2728848 RepID=A0A848IV79_9BURK|nr:TetR/AcrR family transcriptional regulator [Paraburkholderia polaris]
MRARILHAAMDLYSDRNNLSTSIEDVINAADISRGTFYKYFASMDEALIALGRQVTDQMTLDIQPVYDVLTDPLQRISTGMRLFLARALHDTRWAGFVVRAELIPRESVLLDYVYGDLRDGASLAQLDFSNLQAAADSVLGATVEGMRTMMLGRTQDADGYVDEVIRLTLRSLGVSKQKAEAANAFARTYVADREKQR